MRPVAGLDRSVPADTAAQGPRLPGSPRLGFHLTIIRSGRLGDIALILPAARWLQSQGVQVSWLIGADAHRLVRDIPDIDWHVLRGGIQGGRAIADCLPPTTRFCVLETLGLEASLAMSRAPDATVVLAHHTLWNGTPHQLRRYWFGVTGGMPPADAVAHWNIPHNHSYRWPAILISPCASTAERDWTVDGYAAVVAYARTVNLEAIVIHGGGARECEMLRQIRRHIPVRDYRCELPELLEALGSAMCLVSPDSGPVHLAGITGTPVVGIYGRTDPQQWGPYWSQQWSVRGPNSTLPSVDQVLERLKALHRADYPRCGGEGASLLKA